jgi:NAD(P)-dependent dehydrogenase (short-subunit alcohol dehydrogenase family)
MAFRLDGKKALVTGGASGIGRAIALRFAEAGAAVLVADRNLEPAEKVAQEIAKLGQPAVAHRVDVADESQVDAMVARAVEALGGLDIAVASAGVSHARYGSSGLIPQMLSDKSFADWRAVLSVNLDGVFLTDRAAAKAMIQAGKGGSIINIASGAAKLPTPGIGEYSVSKAGVWMLTRVLALELSGFDIKVNAIGPGFIDTPMTKGIEGGTQHLVEMLARVPLRKMGEPIDVANTALFLASEEGRYYTGSILHPDGGVVMQ